ncbi:hypothetical protein BHE74_00024472, partial [Ensete ventricosum]
MATGTQIACYRTIPPIGAVSTPLPPEIGSPPDRHWPLSGGNGRFRSSTTDFGQYQPREKEEKGELGVWRCSPDPDPSPAGDFFARVIRRPRVISSPCEGRRSVSPRRDKERGD